MHPSYDDFFRLQIDMVPVQFHTVITCYGTIQVFIEILSLLLHIYIQFSYDSIWWQEQGKSKAYTTQRSTVFVQCHTVLISECPPLKLVLYTLEQVQTEIDKLDDPRLTEKLSVEVDAEDRE